MLTHQRIWGAIDALAECHQLTPSGLAKKSGLDPTTFNKSKRMTSEDKPRWPSTESVAKILHATGSSLQEFVGLISSQKNSIKSSHHPLPMIGFAEASEEGSFDDGGIPTGTNWKRIHLPEIEDTDAYALEVTGSTMEPLYRAGDVLVISPNAEINPQDRIVIKTTDGQMLAKILQRKTATTIELAAISPGDKGTSLSLEDIDWLARIIWVSQ